MSDSASFSDILFTVVVPILTIKSSGMTSVTVSVVRKSRNAVMIPVKKKSIVAFCQEPLVAALTAIIEIAAITRKHQ